MRRNNTTIPEHINEFKNHPAANNTNQLLNKWHKQYIDHNYRCDVLMKGFFIVATIASAMPFLPFALGAALTSGQTLFTGPAWNFVDVSAIIPASDVIANKDSNDDQKRVARTNYAICLVMALLTAVETYRLTSPLFTHSAAPLSFLTPFAVPLAGLSFAGAMFGSAYSSVVKYDQCKKDLTELERELNSSNHSNNPTITLLIKAKKAEKNRHLKDAVIFGLAGIAAVLGACASIFTAGMLPLILGIASFVFFTISACGKATQLIDDRKSKKKCINTARQILNKPSQRNRSNENLANAVAKEIAIELDKRVSHNDNYGISAKHLPGLLAL